MSSGSAAARSMASPSRVSPPVNDDAVTVSDARDLVSTSMVAKVPQTRLEETALGGASLSDQASDIDGGDGISRRVRPPWRGLAKGPTPSQ